MLPELIVFDLDLTLWDCGGSWCDCLTPPMRKRDGQVLDSNGSKITLYPDVPSIMQYCDECKIPMALASRTQQPTWAADLLQLLDIDRRFRYSEIYPSSKLRHFAALTRESGVEYHKMLFFDDEHRNIDEVSRLGVTCTYVTSGLSRQVFEIGLEEFANG